MATDYAALARQFGGTATSPAAPAPAAPAPASAAAPAVDYAAMATQFGGQAEPQKMGFFESVGEMVTGARRATPETQALPEWTGMPELNQMSVASLKSALGTLVSNPQETVQILKANFPGIEARQDAKGNFILKSSVDQREYAIPPGFSVGDIPRALGGLLAFTPAGRATTLPGAVAAGAGTQAVIEATQAGTGGRFDTGEVVTAGAAGGAGQVVQRAVQAAAHAVKRTIQRATGRPVTPAPAAPTAAPAARIEPTLEPMPAPAAPTAPAAPAGAPIGTAMAPEAVPVAQVATEAFEEVGDLVRKASGSGPGSAAAKAKLADVAQVNPEARSAAERLGMDLPFDVFSDNPQVRAAVGLTRSVAGGEAEAAWVNTMRTAIGKADDVVQQFDAAFIEGRPAPGATSQRILDSLNSTRTQLFNDADVIYKRVDATIPKTATVQFPRLTQTLDDVLAEVGEKGLSAQEKKLYELATDPAVTYGRLLREKNLIGQAMAGKESPYGNMAAGDLKRLYGALAEDQLTNVGQIGGDALRQELRAANLLTAKRKALENRIVGAFGKESDGSVATLMQSAIKSAAKGDAAQFNKLIKVVPPELRKETIATALASVASSGRAAQEGAFGFAEFAKTYRGLRANPPVYKQVIEVLGKDADPVLRDLFEISRRITDARAQVLTTGKANQALVEAMKAEGLIGKVMQSTTAQRVVTGAASAIPGGGFVAPDIVQFMSKGNADAVKAAGKLFASDDFQKLAIEAATKTEPSQAVLRRTAASKAFADFANAAKLPQSLDAKVQWLQSAVQTGRQFDQENQ
ncbi:hypothetical protein UFOVP1374_18 [uncultured Caudovirales phage]|uniref:Uncharacterized protein n=1 Tax=uncultured Caudovirales phage TaxID=2100421 RepID=A0A6J5RV28_9CAUD|nr:hypothetical protein UFOVP1374_18 [uncultured Caudovirales phage]